eukprot:scpid80948/ scgid31055/ 
MNRLFDPHGPNANASLSSGSASLQIVLLSAYLFLGKEGEPRVGSGCDSEQILRYQCWNDRGNSRIVCQFYTRIGGDHFTRRYLGLREEDGLMDTVSVKVDGAQTELQRLESLDKAFKRFNFRPNFTVSRINSSKCKVNRSLPHTSPIQCVNIEIGEQVLNISSKSNINISRMHKKAADGSKPKVCQADPGPFYQEYGSNVEPSPILLTFSVDDDAVWSAESSSSCPTPSFTRTSCATGRLKHSYPVAQQESVPNF